MQVGTIDIPTHKLPEDQWLINNMVKSQAARKFDIGGEIDVVYVGIVNQHARYSVSLLLEFSHL